MKESDYHKLLSFLQDCLVNSPEVSDWDNINDTQTNMLLVSAIKNP